MDQVNGLIDVVLGFLATLFALLMAVFGAIDDWLRAAMSGVGVPPGLQTAVIVVVGVLFLIVVLRSLGGLIRVLLALLLILLLIHVLLPVFGTAGPPTRPL